MQHIDVPVHYHVRYYDKTLINSHTKAGQRNAEVKDHFVDDTEYFLHEFIGPIPWGHSGPLSHALSLSLLLSCRRCRGHRCAGGMRQ